MQPQRYLCRKSKLAGECAPLFTNLLAFPHLAVSNSYLIYTTTLRTSQDLVLVSRPIKTTFLRSWSRSWSRPVWSWSGLGLGLPGLDNISGSLWISQNLLPMPESLFRTTLRCHKKGGRHKPHRVWLTMRATLLWTFR